MKQLLFFVGFLFLLTLTLFFQVAPLSELQPLPSTPATPPPTPVSTPLPSTTLLFGGDVMLGRTVETRIHQHGGTWPLQELAGTMSKADLTVVNLESPFKEHASATKPGSLVLRGEPAGLASLTESGVDLVSLANNHITDMGAAGLQQTKSLLDQHQIAYTGAGESEQEAAKPQIITRNGIRFGFLSYTYGVNFDSPQVYYNVTDIAAMKTQVASLRAQADIIVILAHFGAEYHSKPTNLQTAFAHAAIDAGASLVIGAHPHVPEPYEEYGGGFIFYSLGNLVFDQAEIGNRNFSALIRLTLQGTTIRHLELLPYQIKQYGQPIFLTDPAEKERVNRLFGLPSGQKSF